MSRTKDFIENEANNLGMEFDDYLDYIWDQQSRTKNKNKNYEEIYYNYGENGIEGVNGQIDREDW